MSADGRRAPWPLVVLVASTSLAMGAVVGYVWGQRAEEHAVRVALVRPDSRSPRAREEAGYADGFTGVVVASQDTLVLAQHSARLLDVEIKAGDHVEANQLMGEMDRRALRANKSAKSAEVKAARASLRRARVVLSGAEKRMVRSRGLEGVISAQEREEAELARSEAQAAVREREADVQRLEAELELLQVQLSDSELKAPHAGIIASVFVRPGQWIEKGESLLRIVSEGVGVRFAVPPDVRSRVPPGTRLIFSTEDGNREVQIEVQEVGASVDSASDMVFVNAAILDDSPELKPGTSGVVTAAPQP